MVHLHLQVSDSLFFYHSYQVSLLGKRRIVQRY